MTDARKEELVKTFVNGNNNGLVNLSLQEIIFVYYNINKMFQEKEKNDPILERKRNEVFQAILIKFTSLDTIYIAYNQATGYPHIDEKGSAWVFSELSYAENAKIHYVERFIALDMKELKKDDFISEFCDLLKLGVKSLLIDNGNYNTRAMIKDMMVSDLAPGEEELENPELKFIMTMFFQNCYSKFNFDNKNELLKELELKMMQAIANSNLLVPVRLKNKPNLEDGQVSKVDSPEPVEVPTLTNTDENLEYIPAFTDWTEFTKIYSKDEWNAVIMNYTQLVKASENCGGIMVNASGLPLKINKENQKKIEKMSGEK